jgi:hypothetical protein
LCRRRPFYGAKGHQIVALITEAHLNVSTRDKTPKNNLNDTTDDYEIERQRHNFVRRFVPTVLTDSNLRLAKLAFWQLLMWPFLSSPWEKTKGGTQMTNTEEDQPDVLKEILKMQQETHKLIQQMAQDVRRLKNELGLRDVMR